MCTSGPTYQKFKYRNLCFGTVCNFDSAPRLVQSAADSLYFTQHSQHGCKDTGTAGQSGGNGKHSCTGLLFFLFSPSVIVSQKLSLPCAGLHFRLAAPSKPKTLLSTCHLRSTWNLKQFLPESPWPRCPVPASDCTVHTVA